jgi:isocitrate dehydrogenase (NAD+)
MFMAKRTIVAMPGDGIGKHVLDECIRVLDAGGFETDYDNRDMGWEFCCKEGNPLTDRTIKLFEEHKTGLFGAITSKPKDKATGKFETSKYN